MTDSPPPLAEFLDHSPVAVGVFDPQERLRFANAAFRRAYAIAPGDTPTWEAMMRHCHANRVGLRIDTDDIDAWLARVRQTHRQVPHRQSNPTWSTAAGCGSTKPCARTGGWCSPSPT